MQKRDPSSLCYRKEEYLREMGEERKKQGGTRQDSKIPEVENRF